MSVEYSVQVMYAHKVARALRKCTMYQLTFVHGHAQSFAVSSKKIDLLFIRLLLVYVQKRR